MAIAVIGPLAGQCMIEAAAGQGLIRRQQTNDIHQ